MTPSFLDKISIDLMFCQKSDSAILWMTICLETSKKSNFCRENCIIDVAYIPSFCELDRSFLGTVGFRNFPRFNFFSFLTSGKK